MLTYDEAKRKTNLKQHGIDFSELETVFDHFMETVEDSRVDYGEQRLQSLAWFRGRVVFLVWTERSAGPHVISCRYGDKNETLRYFRALHA